MKVFKFLTDPAPGGYQDRQVFVRWLVKRCAIWPANFWTALRIIAPAPVIFLFSWSVAASLITWLLFAATDFLDGKVARFRGEADGIGVWLDPLADKVFVFVCFWWFGCWANHFFSPWLFWLLVGIELGGRLLIAAVWRLRRQRGDIKAKWWGKIKFSLEIALGACLFLACLAPANWWQLFFNAGLLVVTVFAAISVASHLWRIPNPFKHK
jgi:phosphatidylglycerophosphate synthase